MASRSMYRNNYEDAAKVFAVVILALLLVVAAFGLWYFFYGYHEASTVIVMPNGDGVYKRWSMQRVYETYVSRQSCSYSTTKKRTECTPKYSWNVVDRYDSSGLYRLDTPVEPPSRAFKTCTTLQANAGCERERLEQHWQVRLQVNDGSDKFWCDVRKAQWDDNFGIETVWRIDRNRAQGWLCGTLRKAQS